MLIHFRAVPCLAKLYSGKVRRKLPVSIDSSSAINTFLCCVYHSCPTSTNELPPIRTDIDVQTPLQEDSDCSRSRERPTDGHLGLSGHN